MFLWVYGGTIGLLATLSATSLVENRRVWWQVAATLAFISFAICQWAVFLAWDVYGIRGAVVGNLVLSLVTPITVLAIAALNYRTSNPFVRILRAPLCLAMGFVALSLWMLVFLWVACAFFPYDCL